MEECYDSYRMCGLVCRKFKISDPGPPPYVREAFRQYADGLDRMTADQLLNFLIDHQEERCSAADAEAILQKVLHNGDGCPEARLDGLLTLEDFFFFLLQDDLNGPINVQVHHDMTAPLQHYFIYTGHNSYLTGNQLSSDCSEIPIIRSLENGVRGIELDLWPNSRNDSVRVLHGRTLTTPIPLIKCLNSIKDHAFVASPYPVIITLEDHLTPELQAKVAKMVTQVFGDMLYYPESGCLEEFPSPEALKYKIILSTKPPKVYLVSNNTNMDEENSLPMEKDLSEGQVLVRFYLQQFFRRFLTIKGLTCLSFRKNQSDSDQDEDNNVSRQKSGNVAEPEYKRLIGIHAGNAKKSLRYALRSGIDQVNRLSLSEQKLEKAAESYATDLVRFTQRKILRVFPKGTRVTSSNFRPIVGWMHGAQMVAFNMQGYGKSLWIMHGMFRSNGGCGFVKKPDLLMRKGQSNEVFDPRQPLPVKRILRVNVYMGAGWRFDFSRTHFDAYSPPDFYTKVQITGAEADSANRKTKVIEDDWEPYWNEEFTFPLRIPELAFLRIEVRGHNVSDKDHFGGQTCLPVSELKPGIRAVPLYDRKGVQFKSVRLLMRFQFEQNYT